ncbi:hypothetical protein PRIPAC_72690, partial [Pristionchus pacificus]|uniref:Uncharacterized protein n=1 Tax=Pristionchus pacificus TaxID=54126 RepID=A0A2A6BRG7_PRIPA
TRGIATPRGTREAGFSVSVRPSAWKEADCFKQSAWNTKDRSLTRAADRRNAR